MHGIIWRISLSSCYIYAAVASATRNQDTESEPGGEAGWDHATYEKQIASEKESESGSVRGGRERSGEQSILMNFPTHVKMMMMMTTTTTR